MRPSDGSVWSTPAGTLQATGRLANEDSLLVAARTCRQLRRFAPRFFEAFDFSFPQAGEDLRSALALLKEHNLNGRRRLPDRVPMPFSTRHWESLVLQDGTPDRRIYETAVAATLRDRLRAGDAWVEGSRDYRRFDAYLMPADEARSALAETGLETDGQAWLDERRERLHHRLDEVDRKLARGQLEDVRIEKGRLKITPYEAITPSVARRLDTMIDGLMPRIRITDLLWEVNVRTGFLDAFTDLRSGRVHSDPVAVLAAILAGAINLGLERMANASGQVSHAQLSWANSWHLRTETCSDALARIIDAHHRAAVRPGLGKRRADILGRAVLSVRAQFRAGQSQVRRRPRPEDLLLPVRSVRVVRREGHRRHGRRGSVRPGRARRKRGAVQPPGPLRRHRRRVRSRLRAFSPTRSHPRAASARLPGQASRLLRQAGPLEAPGPDHGQADQ